jgi:glycerol-3-phosphate cytidylyltransferase
MSDGWVYVGGTFDLFHPGHIRFLERCQEFGKVVVALNTDEFAARYKRRPVLSLAERHDLLESCKYVDKVFVNIGNENSGQTIDMMPVDIRISHIAHGDDWTGESLMQQLGIDQAWLDRRGIKMLYIPYTAGISTTDIIGRINGEHHHSGNCSCGLGWSCAYIELARSAKPEAR